MTNGSGRTTGRRILVILSMVAVSFLLQGIDVAYSAPPEGKGKIKTAPLSRTGQTTSYAPGDDGDLQMGIPSPNPRFTDNADGTATDRLTGLMWRTESSYDWRYWLDALNECDSYSGGGFLDWRLPNFKELLSLLDFGQARPMLPIGHPFTYIASEFDTPHGAFYWSSTTSQIFNGVYVIALDRGVINAWWPQTGAGYVLCVRGGS